MTGHAAVLHAHTGSTTGLIIYLVSLLVSLGVGVWFVAYLAHRLDDSGDDDGGGGGGGGGSENPKPRAPRPSPDPDWWPDFERQFADYVQGRQVTRAG